MNDNLTLEELEKMSGLPIRTIRYYIQEGLLWGPDTRGKFATYSQEHLERLELIESLTKRTHLPLKEIRRLLEHATSEQLQQIREILATSTAQVVIIDTDLQGEQPAKAGKSALDYLNNISRVSSSIQESPPAYPQAAVINNMDRTPQLPREIQTRSRTREENWQRITLDDGIELHLRAPRDRKADTKIRELLELARKIFRS